MRKIVLLFMAVLLAVGQLLAQQRTITGKVTDSKGSPVPNASVTVKGSNTGTTTNQEGVYSITIPANAKILVISSVGMEAQEISIGNKGIINASLVAVEKALSEVVVVGYGTQKKSEVTSAISKVDGKELRGVPLSSVDQMLQGKSAGVQSISFSGQPGASQAVRIRGIGSATLSNQPLYVIDGIILGNNGDLSRLTSTSNFLAQINPDDIESISILKDASATAIYGSLGGNGVIIINTKKGKSGKTKFNASVEVGMNSHGEIPDAGKPLRADDWATLFKESYINAGGSAANADAALTNYGYPGADIDWLSLLTRTGTQQQYNISAAGGDDKTKFYVSGGYFKQEANVIGSDLKRMTVVLNLDHTVNNKLSFGLSLQPSYSRENAPLSNSSAFSNPIMEFYFARPLQNPYNPDGTLNITNSTKDWSGSYNPLYIVANDIHSLDYTTAIGKAEVKYNIIPGFSFSSKMGLNYSNLEEYYYNNPKHGDGSGVSGRGYSYYTRYFLYDWVNQFDYRKSFLKNKDLTLSATLGYEALSSKGYFINAQAQNFPTPILVSSATASTPTIASNQGTDYSFLYQFARANLGYRDKYYLQLSFRRDGSSRFSENNQYGNFPSVAGGWTISKESFFQSVDFISNLKLRGSYGITGNAQGLNNYGWRQTYGYGLTYNTAPGGGFNGVGNADLKWESGKQTDLGLDASFLKDRINIIVDVYKRVTDHLIFPFPPSLTIGFSSITKNVGEFANKGVEFTIDATPVKTRDFNWDVNFNITHNQNRVTKIPPGQTAVANGSFNMVPGHDYYEYFLKVWAGVDPATGNPQWYLDTAKSTVTTNRPSAPLLFTGKSASPKFFGGFSNTFSYKEFGVTADFYYNFGNYVQDQWATYLTDEINPSYGKYSYTLKRWQKPGDITDVPKLVYGSTSQSANASTRFLYKGDFIRLRNLQITYTANSKLASKMHLGSLNFYVRGTNLWSHIYDKNIPFDPEQGVSSQSNLNFFYNRTVTFGVNVGF